MKLLRKVSRRRYGSAVYESERILVPIPAEERDTVKPWLDKDLKIHVRRLSYGFSILVTGRDRVYVDGVAPRLKFERLMKEMEPKPPYCGDVPR